MTLLFYNQHHMTHAYYHRRCLLLLVSSSLSSLLPLLLLLHLVVNITLCNSQLIPTIQINNENGVFSDVDSAEQRLTTYSPVFCACDAHTKKTSGNCTLSGTCPSLSGCCRVNVWYHNQYKNISIDLPGCSISEDKPPISHDPLGGHEGDAIFVLNCCGRNGCNNLTEADLEKTLKQELCNYTLHTHDEVLHAFRQYCVKDPSLFPLLLLLAIPVSISLCIVCVVFVYTRRVSHCSAKQFLIHLFAGPKCWCVRYNKHRAGGTLSGGGRSRLRSSDTSAQQPLFEVATFNHGRCDNISSNISSLTDSGFSNGGQPQGRKKISDSQGTQTSSLANSAVGGVGGAHRCLLTSSFSTASSGNNLPGTTVQSSRLLQPHTELDCDTIGEVTNSGSGAGVPSLGRRTMAYQIQLHEVIGRGRYGVVHRGEMFCDPVAVKIFQSRDERAWLRERQIYTTHGMQHEYILAFRGADSKDTGLTTELWLVTEFHSNGSLFDFLSLRTVNLQMALKLAYTLICGLAHLHLEISGTPGKPAIAHRDLKSRNVLIKANHTCCLADFGFAVTYASASNRLEQSPASLQCCVGTRRYMSNEILDKTLDCDNFTSFTAADLYALGLVLWEILRRTELPDTVTGVAGPADEMELPFMEYGIGVDPSQDDMYRIVCVEKKRPTIPNRFNRSDNVNNVNNKSDGTISNNSSNNNSMQLIASSLGQLVDELWQETPTARPTALQVKKSLLRLMKT